MQETLRGFDASLNPNSGTRKPVMYFRVKPLCEQACHTESCPEPSLIQVASLTLYDLRDFTLKQRQRKISVRAARLAVDAIKMLICPQKGSGHCKGHSIKPEPRRISELGSEPVLSCF